jgi:hypothetical protein
MSEYEIRHVPTSANLIILNNESLIEETLGIKEQIADFAERIVGHPESGHLRANLSILKLQALADSHTKLLEAAKESILLTTDAFYSLEDVAERFCEIRATLRKATEEAEKI